MARTIKKSRAFTLVELMVVIAIIAILIAMLLPAIQAAREAGRMSQCRNNMHQLGIGLHAYHDAYKLFPPSSDAAGDASITYNGVKGQNGSWAIHTLPFFDEGNLYHSVDWKAVAQSGGLYAYSSVSGPQWIDFTSKEIPTLLCPSDKNNALKNRIDGSGKKFGRQP